MFLFNLILFFLAAIVGEMRYVLLIEIPQGKSSIGMCCK